MKCKYEGSGVWAGRCVGTKHVDPCIGQDKCDMFKPAGCEFCGEYEDLPEHFVNGQPVGCVFDTCINEDQNGWHIVLPIGANIGIQFCPMCGRKLGG